MFHKKNLIKIFVGFNVLDLSKLLKYDFHYNYIKRKYDAELLFTDKDSLTYKTKREENFYKDKDLFNFSNYRKYSKLFYHSTIKEIGKMKDESEEKIIIDFIRLKSKMYSLIDVDGKENKRAKRIKSVVVENIKNIVMFCLIKK